MAGLCSGIRKFILSQKKPATVTFTRNKKIRPWDSEYDMPTYVYAPKKKKSKSTTYIYTVGDGEQGQLGYNNIFFKKRTGQKLFSAPLELRICGKWKIQDVACGIHFTVMLRKDKDEHTCYGTGLTTDGQIGLHYPEGGNVENGLYFEPEDISQYSNRKKPHDVLITFSPIKLSSSDITCEKVACGRAHTVIAANNGNIYTLGNNSYGQCGRAIIPEEEYQFQSHTHKIDLFNGKSIDSLICGMDTSFVVSEGKVFSCGLSADGQSGQGVYKSVENFSPVEGDLKQEKVIKLACSADCVLAVTENGNVFGWGNGEYRQFSMVTDQPQLRIPVHLPLYLDSKIIDVATTGSACFALTESGNVWSWGQGWLGRGPEDLVSSKPVMIPSTLFGRNIINPHTKVTNIYSGVSMVAAINSEGQLYTWGRNVTGCLGLRHMKNMYFPFMVCLPGKVKKVSCGEGHMAILTKSTC